MKLAHISDLHIDHNNANAGTSFGEKYFERFLEAYAKRNDAAKRLLISGDISDQALRSIRILDMASTYFDYVLFVDGNHESYMNAFSTTKKRLIHEYDYLTKTNYKVGYLYAAEPIAYFSDGAMIIGANGWYDFNAPLIGDHDTQVRNWQMRSRDAEIKFGSTAPRHLSIQKEAMRDAGAVERALETATRTGLDIVVMTHTLPKFSLVGMQNGRTPDHAGSLFSSYMEQVFDKYAGKIKAWCCGHQHYRQFPVVDGVQISCNPYGYVWKENSGQMPYGVFEFDSHNPTEYNYVIP